jgi:hypothetical protein
MERQTVIILILFLLLIISIINQCWLLKNVYYTKRGINKINYFDHNLNKWPETEFKTFTYIYPKKWQVDRCYGNECDMNDNLITSRLNAFHNELTQIQKNKVLILSNEFNIAPQTLSINDLIIISNLK